jgi:hypothetical protein
MPPWNHNWISFDGLIVHHAGMTCGAPFAFAPLGESLHMLAMAHDQSDILDGRWQIPHGDFRDPQNVPVTTQTNRRIDMGLEIVGRSRRAEQ